MRDALAAAQLWGGVRPTALLSSRTPSTGDWSEADRMLAIAWALDRAAMCPGGCGHYLDGTVGIDGWHTTKSVICDGCQARDQHREETKDAPPVPGQLVFVERDPNAPEPATAW